MNNPECKKCGLLKSTVDGLAPFGPTCVNNGSHSFDLGTPVVPGYKTTNANTTAPPLKQEEWEEEFEKLFDLYLSERRKQNIKSFVHQTLQKERERLASEIQFIIAEETNLVRTAEGGQTSRLTSCYNRIMALLKG